MVVGSGTGCRAEKTGSRTMTAGWVRRFIDFLLFFVVFASLWIGYMVDVVFLFHLPFDD